MKRMIFTIIQGIGMAVVLSLLSMWIGEQFFQRIFLDFLKQDTEFPFLPQRSLLYWHRSLKNT